ncbi:transglutaminase domain-containing protein [Methanobacterium oryzae]|uniref:transglutaminase domain-containing protein n=1 Tax=Methanobacterium oryzae TaxID=69540 RepID=UPI003D25459E
MKRLSLLVMLLLLSGTLLNVTNIYAATENSFVPETNINTDIVQNNTTEPQNDEKIQNTTGIMENNTSQPVNNLTAQNLQTSENTSNSNENKQNTTNSTNLTNVQNSTDAAGDEEYKNARGIWLKAEDVGKLNIDEIKKAGITDIFVKANILTTPGYQTVLKALLDKLKSTNTNVRVHAWVTCFKDPNGKWIDPQGTYNYTVKVPYTVKVQTKYKSWYKSWSKSWYKSWYKYNGKWKYKWKYKWEYTWEYTWKYKLENKTLYKNEIKYGKSTAYVDGLIKSISDIVKNYDIDGIHLDYIRYSGSGNNSAYLHAGGTESITSFVKRVNTAVKSIKSKVAVSAAVMPECATNAKYYGQNYTQLAKYLDFLVPMIYKGNYKKNSTWIGTTTKWIVDHSGGKPVLVGLQTYENDTNTTPISSSELNNDINAAISNKASGYVLFRYGLIDDKFFKNPNDNSITFTLTQIQNAAISIKTFIDGNKRLPSYITIGTKQVSMSEMLRLMAISTLQLSSGIKTPVTLKNTDTPRDPSDNMINGTLNKTEYLKIAQRIKSYIDSKGVAPNFATSSLGNIGYESTIYMYAKIVTFYKSNSRLPSYVTMNTWKEEDIPSDLQKYLNPTKNCQSDNANIKALAASLTKGISSTYDKGTKIFNWVRDNLSYEFYYNTKYGAVNTYQNKKGNCVDHSHLLIALARAAGIPAKYMHGTCNFTSGTVYGHVWAQLYINGKWYNADAISSRNTLGAINNWNKTSVVMKGNYAELPF